MKRYIFSIFFIFISSFLLQAQNEFVLIKVKKEGKFGFLDENGKEVIPCKFNYLGKFSEGLVNAQIGNNWYYYDGQGNQIIDLRDRYEECGEFHEGKAVAYKGQKWKREPSEKLTYYHFINRKGQEIIKIDTSLKVYAEFPRPIFFSDGLLCMNSSQRISLIGYLNEKGKIELPFRFFDNYNGLFSEGLAQTSIYSYSQTKRHNKYGEGGVGYINKEGAFVIPPRYHSAMPFNHGAAIVTMEYLNNGGWDTYLINKKGEKIFADSIYTSRDLHQDSMVGIFSEQTDYPHKRKYALAKTNGQIITDFEFDAMKAGELWAVEKNNKLGFINNKGETVIPYSYYGANSMGFKGGISVVKVDPDINLLAVINSKNEIIIPATPKVFLYNKNGIIQRYTIPLQDDNDAEYFNKEGKKIDLTGYKFAGYTDEHRFQIVK